MILRTKKIGLDYLDGKSRRTVLNDINLEFDNGEKVIIAGPSGSGKSSLVYLLSTLRKPTSGSVFYKGEDITNSPDQERIRLQDFGFIFQQHFLISYLNILENVCIANNKKDIKVEAMEILEKLGLGELMFKKPYQISGGERQRAAIARALVKKPAIIFADEPTASLDRKNALQVYQTLKEYSKGKLLIMTTHDMSLLSGDERVIYLEKLNK